MAEKNWRDTQTRRSHIKRALKFFESINLGYPVTKIEEIEAYAFRQSKTEEKYLDLLKIKVNEYKQYLKSSLGQTRDSDRRAPPSPSPISKSSSNLRQMILIDHPVISGFPQINSNQDHPVISSFYSKPATGNSDKGHLSQSSEPQKCGSDHPPPIRSSSVNSNASSTNNRNSQKNQPSSRLSSSPRSPKSPECDDINLNQVHHSFESSVTSFRPKFQEQNLSHSSDSLRSSSSESSRGISSSTLKRKRTDDGDDRKEISQQVPSNMNGCAMAQMSKPTKSTKKKRRRKSYNLFGKEIPAEKCGCLPCKEYLEQMRLEERGAIKKMRSKPCVNTPPGKKRKMKVEPGTQPPSKRTAPNPPDEEMELDLNK